MNVALILVMYMCDFLFLQSTMADETCRTRSQKRALEREVTHNDVDNKKIKLEKGLLDGDLMVKTEAGKVPALLKSGEVKATIKVEVPTGDEPMDMSTAKRYSLNIGHSDLLICSESCFSYL